MCEPQARNLDLVGRETVEHEGVVRIRAVGNGDFTSADGGKAGHLCFSVRWMKSERTGRQSTSRCESLPTANCSGCEHDLEDFGKNKPVQTEAEGFRKRMSVDVQPGNPECE